MLNKLLARLGYERKESRTWGALTQLGIDTPVWTPRDYEHLTRAAYQLNADVYAAVNLIARNAKPVPWLVMNTEGGTSVRDSHPLVKLLKRPNERETGSDFKEAAIAYLLLSGNSYIDRSGGTEKTPPAFLYTNRPDRWRVIKGTRRNIVAGYEYKAGGEPIPFQPWEVLHMRLFNPLDDYYGMSPIEAAAYTIDNSNEAAALYKKLMQKGYPPGAIIFKGDAMPETDEEIARFKRGIQRSRQNEDVLLLRDAEWREMGFKPVDASLFQGRLFNKRDIAAIYGVPSGMMGDTQVKTFANSREERRSLYTEAVIPALTKLRDALNGWLSPLYDGAYIDFDKDAIDALAEDRDTQAKRVVSLFQANLIKRNEGRAELKYDAVPDDEDGYFNELSVSPTSEGSDPGLQDPNADDEDLPAAETEGRRPGRRQPIPITSVRRADEGRARQIKAFNLLSEEQKDNYWKAVEDRRSLWYARVAADVEERFQIERNQVLKAFRDNGETAALRAVTKQEDDWMKLYRSTILAVAEDFGRQTIQSIKSDGFSELEIKFEFDFFTQTVLKWIMAEGAKRVVGVLDVTKQQIRTELAAGVAAGEGIFDLSKRLQAMYREFSNVRAERIARTEVISASNLGSQTAAKSTNLPLEKHWIATFDNRTRSPHRHAHGQKRGINEPYIVMGQKLMFPGDSSLDATPDNTIQCRCTESYRVKRG